MMWYLLASLIIPVLWGWAAFRLTASLFHQKRRSSQSSDDATPDFQI
ncbi:MAG: hypothetical protein KDA96_00390 [Planctomycetaceae bacterium]|nr:hypothetical protein [Planctomycetaceae bacterium]